jgi:PEP-CTERM motif
MLGARATFLLLMAVTASADSVYAVFDNGGANSYGSLDTATGVFTPIGAQTPNLFGMGFATNGNMYGTDSQNPNAGVYQIDPLTGNLTSLGASTNSTVGSTVGNNGLIYAVSNDSNAIFYTIDPGTLNTNIINTLGFQSDGLALFANGLFYTDVLGAGMDSLVSVDPSTGIATVIGTGMGVQIYTGTNVNGTIYGGNNLGNLYTIDLTTGVATLVTAITGAGGNLDALAFNNNAVPEPSTLLLGGIALAAIAVLKSRC